tara:strand:+ start:758 stop:874 length:117 start_codon:yes stop_codon:yes gene_type:complete
MNSVAKKNKTVTTMSGEKKAFEKNKGIFDWNEGEKCRK